MGVTDVYSITVDGVKNFKARLEAEEVARRSWNEKWGWMLDEYKKINNNLIKLRGERVTTHVEQTVDERTTLPIPESVNHEYGWLATRPEFKLDVYRSPGLARLPKEFPKEKLWEIVDQYELSSRNAKTELKMKAHMNAEELQRRLWLKNWGWIVDEYRKISDSLERFKRQTVAAQQRAQVKVLEDNRTILPKPNSTNHEYGWLVSRREFLQGHQYKTPGLSRLPKEFPRERMWEIMDQYVRTRK